MKYNLKRDLCIGAVFTAVSGTLTHFVYEWSGRHLLIGLFVPVSESTWEHTKMLYFPMLAACCWLYRKYCKLYPGILSGLSGGLLVGCLMIPVLFYTYTGILGFHTLFLDVMTFFASIAAAFWTAQHLIQSGRARFLTSYFLITTGLLFFAFLGFTYCPPDLFIFR